jgi:hypothetical protein
MRLSFLNTNLEKFFHLAEIKVCGANNIIEYKAYVRGLFDSLLLFL